MASFSAQSFSVSLHSSQRTGLRVYTGAAPGPVSKVFITFAVPAAAAVESLALARAVRRKMKGIHATVGPNSVTFAVTIVGLPGLEALLPHVMDRLLFFAVAPEDLSSEEAPEDEGGVVQQPEISALVGTRVDQFLYPDSAVGGCDGGGDDGDGGGDANEMTAGGLQHFYTEWYRPDNCSIVVTGQVDAKSVLACLEPLERKVLGAALDPAIGAGAASLFWSMAESAPSLSSAQEPPRRIMRAAADEPPLPPSDAAAEQSQSEAAEGSAAAGASMPEAASNVGDATSSTPAAARAPTGGRAPPPALAGSTVALAWPGPRWADFEEMAALRVMWNFLAADASPLRERLASSGAELLDAAVCPEAPGHHFLRLALLRAAGAGDPTYATMVSAFREALASAIGMPTVDTGGIGVKAATTSGGDAEVRVDAATADTEAAPSTAGGAASVAATVEPEEEPRAAAMTLDAREIRASVVRERVALRLQWEDYPGDIFAAECIGHFLYGERNVYIGSGKSSSGFGASMISSGSNGNGNDSGGGYDGGGSGGGSGFSSGSGDSSGGAVDAGGGTREAAQLQDLLQNVVTRVEALPHDSEDPNHVSAFWCAFIASKLAPNDARLPLVVALPAAGEIPATFAARVRIPPCGPLAAAASDAAMLAASFGRSGEEGAGSADAELSAEAAVSLAAATSPLALGRIPVVTVRCEHRDAAAIGAGSADGSDAAALDPAVWVSPSAGVGVGTGGGGAPGDSVVMRVLRHLVASGLCLRPMSVFVAPPAAEASSRGTSGATATQPVAASGPGAEARRPSVNRLGYLLVGTVDPRQRLPATLQFDHVPSSTVTVSAWADTTALPHRLRLCLPLLLEVLTRLPVLLEDGLLLTEADAFARRSEDLIAAGACLGAPGVPGLPAPPQQRQRRAAFRPGAPFSQAVCVWVRAEQHRYQLAAKWLRRLLLQTVLTPVVLAAAADELYAEAAAALDNAGVCESVLLSRLYQRAAPFGLAATTAGPAALGAGRSRGAAPPAVPGGSGNGGGSGGNGGGGSNLVVTSAASQLLFLQRLRLRLAAAPGEVIAELEELRTALAHPGALRVHVVGDMLAQVEPVQPFTVDFLPPPGRRWQQQQQLQLQGALNLPEVVAPAAAVPGPAASNFGGAVVTPARKLLADHSTSLAPTAGSCLLIAAAASAGGSAGGSEQSAVRLGVPLHLPDSGPELAALMVACRYLNRLCSVGGMDGSSGGYGGGRQGDSGMGSGSGGIIVGGHGGGDDDSGAGTGRGDGATEVIDGGADTGGGGDGGRGGSGDGGGVRSGASRGALGPFRCRFDYGAESGVLQLELTSSASVTAAVAAVAEFVQACEADALNSSVLHQARAAAVADCMELEATPNAAAVSRFHRYLAAQPASYNLDLAVAVAAVTAADVAAAIERLVSRLFERHGGTGDGGYTVVAVVSTSAVASELAGIAALRMAPPELASLEEAVALCGAVTDEDSASSSVSDVASMDGSYSGSGAAVATAALDHGWQEAVVKRQAGWIVAAGLAAAAAAAMLAARRRG
ncbi:unnamed protein product [Phaeothamnion confervicola]